ncbi:MAG: hypothetical protein Barrevirus2_13 [Barrevirus sp.]|uniref:Uncharacterized protein n=1 Tax=Barrevirus sp. TaxID=2487763 RepID=A0A3G4ZPN4_9VIRU|nr:MAG: hypothetical protein Barrevirus2_13 [Barrevirus sp.]
MGQTISLQDKGDSRRMPTGVPKKYTSAEIDANLNRLFKNNVNNNFSEASHLGFTELKFGEEKEREEEKAAEIRKRREEQERERLREKKVEVYQDRAHPTQVPPQTGGRKFKSSKNRHLQHNIGEFIRQNGGNANIEGNPISDQSEFAKIREYLLREAKQGSPSTNPSYPSYPQMSSLKQEPKSTNPKPVHNYPINPGTIIYPNPALQLPQAQQGMTTVLPASVIRPDQQNGGVIEEDGIDYLSISTISGFGELKKGFVGGTRGMSLAAVLQSGQLGGDRDDGEGLSLSDDDDDEKDEDEEEEEEKEDEEEEKDEDGDKEGELSSTSSEEANVKTEQLSPTSYSEQHKTRRTGQNSPTSELNIIPFYSSDSSHAIPYNKNRLNK